MDALEARPTPPTTAQVVDAVGPRLRWLRERRDVTLAALAAETGISVSTLSRLESGQRRPTLELLLPLARAYQVPLDDLVGAPQTGDPRVHLKPEQHGGRVVIPLTKRTGGVRSFKQLIPPMPSNGDRTLKTHEGYEWLYVLSGRVRLLLGERDFDLGPGEVVEFDTRTPHWVGNTSDAVAEVLCLYGPQGERAHVRSRPTG
ncbi:helix-turn-helix domain-containing protein [Curtobacterium oceanosedimentum]|uniref:XRE family transcriptional regulator n=1 Tax=Curtobacterium oceanosedimentum TaxID=465820 RepID=A0A147DQ02_9MICO|nr:helix-turn-helix transcriptional regulator [Curtobacterium oceanosedimentum]KTR51589.1 XRE family transcriptional regulator [Curtobacterium oceanosedimentum]